MSIRPHFGKAPHSPQHDNASLHAKEMSTPAHGEGRGNRNNRNGQQLSHVSGPFLC